MKPVLHIIRFFVGGLFIFSGLIKINDPVGTAIKLEEYFNVFAADGATFFLWFAPYALYISVFLCVLEVVLGVALLLNYQMKATTWVLLLTILFFTFLTFYSAYFNKVTDCGCFGDAIKLTPWESFTKDIILLVLIVVLFVFRKRFSSFLSPVTGHAIMGAVIVVNVVIAVYAIQHLPYKDFRAYKVGTNIPAAMQPSEQLRYSYVMLVDGQEKEFDQYPNGEEYKFKEMKLLNPEAQPTITDYSVWNEEEDYTEESFRGNKLVIVIYDAEKAEHDVVTEINNLLRTLPPSITPVVFTASGKAAYEQFSNKTGLQLPYYFADATVLKTMIRANPGIVLLQNGTVKGKWHYNDLPTVADLRERIN